MNAEYGQNTRTMGVLQKVFSTKCGLRAMSPSRDPVQTPSMSTPTNSFKVRRPADRAIARLSNARAQATQEVPAEYQNVRRLIWLYFWLLMFEGALRKWILPGFSNILLVIRDPVLLLCYYLALKNRAFPRTAFLPCIVLLGAVAVLFSVIGMLTGTSRTTFVVLLYGLRASFFHLPLIFVMASVFTRRDVEKVGRWLLIIAVPMVVLVFFQYRGGQGAWVNVGAGGVEGGQILVAVSGHDDKIRPAGVFSYNTGLAAYLALVGAFLALHYLTGGKSYAKALTTVAAVALMASVALAVSRSTALGLAIVGVAAGLCALLRSEFSGGALRIVLLLGIVVAGLGSTTFFHEGLNILGARFEEADGLKVGIVDRSMTGFTAPLEKLSTAPFFGAGLGIGTNVGSKLLTGRAGFMLSEGDWDRAVDEMGPVVGVLYVGLRIAIVICLISASWKSLRGGSPLSFLLVAASGLSILNGNFAQPTSLGFAVFGGGLCLAAAKKPEPVEEIGPASVSVTVDAPAPLARIRGRSVIAERLHGGGRKG